MKKNLNITKPWYSKLILPVPWSFVMSKFHSGFHCNDDYYKFLFVFTMVEYSTLHVYL